MKKVIIFIIVVALVLTITPALIFAKNGPADKATGSIEAAMGSAHLYAEFNAHAAIGEKLSKGMYHVWGTVGSSSLDWYGDINEVNISGNTATLHGTFASGVDENGNSPIGQAFTLVMTDSGSPGAGNDTFSSGWGSTAGFAWTIVSGNLVVHNYE